MKTPSGHIKVVLPVSGLRDQRSLAPHLHSILSVDPFIYQTNAHHRPSAILLCRVVLMRLGGMAPCHRGPASRGHAPWRNRACPLKKGVACMSAWGRGRGRGKVGGAGLFLHFAEIKPQNTIQHGYHSVCRVCDEGEDRLLLQMPHQRL